MDEREEVCQATCQPIGDIHIRDNIARSINITPLNYGYAVTVGCQNFAVEKLEILIEKLIKYLKNPAEVEENWLKNKIL